MHQPFPILRVIVGMRSLRQLLVIVLATLIAGCAPLPKQPKTMRGDDYAFVKEGQSPNSAT